LWISSSALPIVSGRVESETHRITWPPIAGETAQKAKGCWLLAFGHRAILGFG